MAFLLQIVTPEGKALSEEVNTVVLPGALGEMGILTAHSNLVSTITAGELRYVKDGKEVEMAVGGGFVEVTGDHVNVLTDMAATDSQIDEATVEAALARAQERLKDPGTATPEEIAAVEAAVANSMAQLRVKRKRRAL